MTKKKRKLIDVDIDDVLTLSVHALTTKDIKFKAYVENLISDQAEKVRNKMIAVEPKPSKKQDKVITLAKEAGARRRARIVNN